MTYRFQGTKNDASTEVLDEFVKESMKEHSKMVQIKHKRTCATKGDEDEEIDEAIDEFMRYFSQEKHDDLLDTNTDLFSAVEAHKNKMK